MSLGIPKLPRLTDFKGTLNNILARTESQLWGLITAEAIWGVFEKGTSTVAVEVDSVLELTAQSESNVSDYRIQENSFASYNKVTFPFEIPLRLSKGGSISERKALLTWCETNVQKATIFDIQTPENVYANVTLTRYSVVRRRESGEDLVTVDCVFKEIREAPTVYYKDGFCSVPNPQNQADLPSNPVQTVNGVLTQIKTGAKNIFDVINRINKGDIYKVVTSGSEVITDVAEIAKKTAKDLIDYTNNTIGK